MWSEEMDDKIRGAAENDRPAYNAKTWQGMEALLNQHLPQKKKRRGFFFFFIPALLIAIAGTILIIKYSGNQQLVPVNDRVSSQQAAPGDQQPAAGRYQADNQQPVARSQESPGSQPTILADKNTGDNAGIVNIQVTNAGIGNDNSKDNKNIAGPAKPSSIRKAGNSSMAVITAATATMVTTPAITGNNTGDKKRETVSTTNNPVAYAPATIDNPGSNGENTTVAMQPVKSTNATADTATIAAIVKATTSQPDSTTVPVAVAQPQKDLSRNKKAGRFFISVSAGADLTSVGTYKVGKLKNEYGAGIGYLFGKHIAVRTGFYVGRKIYSADSNNYHTPYTSGPYSYRLAEINANCLVYEVPVLVSYSFGQSAKHNWFASTGFSSYFMKKEDYIYTYKAPSGQLIAYDHDFANENRHIFSVLDLSGGYQHHFSKRFSLMAEPYIKIPLTGIGAGSVKLNSAGVLISAMIRPFTK